MTLEWGKCNIFLLLGCLLIGCSYWIPLAGLYAPDYSLLPWATYGQNGTDFRIFYWAGSLWLLHGNPYPPLPATGLLYPPPSLPFYGAFALFDFSFASQLWMLTYFSLFAVALLALALTVKADRRYVYLSIAFLLFLTSYPLFINLQLGQSDLLVASFGALSLVFERLRRGFASAVFLSVATLLKGPPVLLLIYFVLFRRDLRYFGYFLVSCIVIVGVSLLAVPAEYYWYYIVGLVPRLWGAFGLRSNQSIVGAMSVAGMSQLTPLVSLTGFGLLAVFSLYVNSNRWAGAFGNKALRADGMFLMNVLVMLLFHPRSTVYPYVWVILPMAYFLSSILLMEVRTYYLLLACVGAFLLNSALSPNFLNYREFPLALMGNLILVISLILIYIYPKAIITRMKIK